MKGSLKYKPDTLYFSTQHKFPGEDFFQVPGLLDIIQQMKVS